MGYPSPTTVKFFNQYKCRLNFLDLINPEFLSACPTEADHSVLVDYFRAGLDIQPEVIIDICLFWDFFNYLDGTLIKAFIEALQPYVAEHTRGFGLGALNSRCQLPNSRYGLMAEDKLTQCPQTEPQRPVFPHSQRDLNSHFDYFEINKSRLMSDGRVEYLITRCNQSERAIKPIF